LVNYFHIKMATFNFRNNSDGNKCSTGVSFSNLEAANTWNERLHRVETIDELENIIQKSCKYQEKLCPFCAGAFNHRKNRNKHILGHRCQTIKEAYARFSAPSPKGLTQ
jgi:hypothetical protein